MKVGKTAYLHYFLTALVLGLALSINGGAQGWAGGAVLLLLDLFGGGVIIVCALGLLQYRRAYGGRRGHRGHLPAGAFRRRSEARRPSRTAGQHRLPAADILRGLSAPWSALSLAVRSLLCHSLYAGCPNLFGPLRTVSGSGGGKNSTGGSAERRLV